MSYAASVLVAALVVLVLLVAGFGGATASLLCLVLERRAAGRSIRGRSACVCGVPIPLHRNVPVVSWLVQRGRARCCGAAIPRWYVEAELVCAGATAAGLLLGGWIWSLVGLVLGVGAVGSEWTIRHARAK